MEYIIIGVLFFAAIATVIILVFKDKKDSKTKYICNKSKYTCDEDDNGTYDDKDSCSKDCTKPTPVVKYSCDATSKDKCKEDPDGVYTSKKDCQDKCWKWTCQEDQRNKTWSCIQNENGTLDKDTCTSTCGANCLYTVDNGKNKFFKCDQQSGGKFENVDKCNQMKSEEPDKLAGVCTKYKPPSWTCEGKAGKWECKEGVRAGGDSTKEACAKNCGFQCSYIAGESNVRNCKQYNKGYFKSKSDCQNGKSNCIQVE